MKPYFILASLSLFAPKMIKAASSEVIHIKANKSLLRTPDFGYAFFESHPNSKLEVKYSLKAHAQHPKQCALGCVKNMSCLSFNFGKQPIFFYQGKAQYLCELLATDKYNSSSMFQNENQNFNHYSIRSNCSKSPCLHNFACIPKYTEGTYECLCPRPPFEGKHCKDVDECNTGQHNCDVNAICANTIGSYKCTCKDGYTGNGINCSAIPTLEESEILGNHANHSYIVALKTFMDQVPEEITNVKWIRCWSGRHDGWHALHLDFHTRCLNKGPSITIARKNQYIWGGYTDVPWTTVSTYPFKASSKSFIFSLYNIQGFNPQKFDVLDATEAVNHYYNHGPTFGSGYDLIIGHNAATTASCSNKPRAYAIPPGCTKNQYCNFFNGEVGPYAIDDVEVLYKKL